LIGIIPELHCRTGWSERLGLREAEGLGSWDAANCRKKKIHDLPKIWDFETNMMKIWFMKDPNSRFYHL